MRSSNASQWTDEKEIDELKYIEGNFISPNIHANFTPNYNFIRAIYINFKAYNTPNTFEHVREWIGCRWTPIVYVGSLNLWMIQMFQDMNLRMAINSELQIPFEPLRNGMI